MSTAVAAKRPRRFVSRYVDLNYCLSLVFQPDAIIWYIKQIRTRLLWFAHQLLWCIRAPESRGNSTRWLMTKHWRICRSLAQTHWNVYLTILHFEVLIWRIKTITKWWNNIAFMTITIYNKQTLTSLNYIVLY